MAYFINLLGTTNYLNMYIAPTFPKTIYIKRTSTDDVKLGFLKAVYFVVPHQFDND